MISEIEISGASRGHDGAKIARYGVKTNLPNVSGSLGEPVAFEVMHRRRFGSDSTFRYHKKVSEVQKHSIRVQGEKEQYALHHWLDGESMRQIAKKMNVSEATVRRLRECILD